MCIRKIISSDAKSKFTDKFYNDLIALLNILCFIIIIFNTNTFIKFWTNIPIFKSQW